MNWKNFENTNQKFLVIPTTIAFLKEFWRLNIYEGVSRKFYNFVSKN